MVEGNLYFLLLFAKLLQFKTFYGIIWTFKWIYVQQIYVFYVKLCMTKDIFTQLQVQLSKRKYSPL